MAQICREIYSSIGKWTENNATVILRLILIASTAVNDCDSDYENDYDYRVAEHEKSCEICG